MTLPAAHKARAEKPSLACDGLIGCLPFWRLRTSQPRVGGLSVAWRKYMAGIPAFIALRGRWLDMRISTLNAVKVRRGAECHRPSRRDRSDARIPPGSNSAR